MYDQAIGWGVTKCVCALRVKFETIVLESQFDIFVPVSGLNIIKNENDRSMVTNDKMTTSHLPASVSFCPAIMSDSQQK